MVPGQAVTPAAADSGSVGRALWAAFPATPGFTLTSRPDASALRADCDGHGRERSPGLRRAPELAPTQKCLWVNVPETSSGPRGRPPGRAPWPRDAALCRGPGRGGHRAPARPAHAGTPHLWADAGAPRALRLPRPRLGPRPRWTKRGLDRAVLCPRSQGETRSRHRASRPLQRPAKLPVPGPGAAAASQGWAGSGLPADTGRPPRPLPSAGPLSRSGLCLGGRGEPPPAPWGCLDPDPGSRPPGWHGCAQGARAEGQREPSTCRLCCLLCGLEPGLGGRPRGPGAPGPPGAGLPAASLRDGRHGPSRPARGHAWARWAAEPRGPDAGAAGASAHP